MVKISHSFHSAGVFTDTNLTQLNQKHDSTDDLRTIFSANASYAALRKAVRTEVAQSMVITAIARKRYELRHHQRPATLDELTPDFLQTVPIDCMSGQSLCYHRNADGYFLLYSVGENGVDDGGNPSLEPGVTSSNYAWQNPHALDWVWPQPASAAEIQKYYENQAKELKNWTFSCSKQIYLSGPNVLNCSHEVERLDHS